MKYKLTFAIFLYLGLIVVATRLSIYLVNVNLEFPLKYVLDIYQHPDSRIYVDNNAFNRIQVYEPDGKFLYGWSVNPYDFGSSVSFTKDKIYVLAAFEKYLLVYNYSGNLIETIKKERDIRKVLGGISKERSKDLKFEYQYYLFPRIYRIIDGKKVTVISSPWYYVLFHVPVVLLLIVISFLVTYYKLNIKRVNHR
jgi:hypothetical protein